MSRIPADSPPPLSQPAERPLKLFFYRPGEDFSLDARLSYLKMPLTLDTPAEASFTAKVDPSYWRFHPISPDWRHHGPWRDYRYDPRQYAVTGNPTEADFFVFPFMLEEMIEAAGPGGASSWLRQLPFYAGNERRHVFMTLHDSSERLHLEGVCFRASIRRSCRDERAVAVPYAVEDLIQAAHFDPARIRYDTSFAGYIGCSASGPVRRQVIASLAKARRIRAFLSVSPRFQGHQPETERQARRALFLKSLAESWTVACPRGTGVNTYRFFETLSMGRIPVLLSDDCLLPFEERIEYDAFILRIAEKDAGRTADIIADWMSTQTADTLLARCRLARRTWESYFACTQWNRRIIETLQKLREPEPSRVVIDGVIFQLQRGRAFGISRLWHSLMVELGKGELGPRILLLDRDGTAPAIPGITARRIPGYRIGSAGEETAALDDLCRQAGAGLFISTYYTYTRETPSLLMLYDMIPERIEAAGPQATHSEWRDKQAAISQSTAFAAISESTALDFERFYPERAARRPAAVIPCAVTEDFNRPEPERIEAFRRRRGIGRPYFLLVGRRDAHKNQGLFFDAFARLADRERYAIVMAGGQAELDPAWCHLAAGAEIHQGFFPEEELPSLYGGALALVYPSRYEGFGLPLLEAMRCGCPVITCHNSSLFEVARHAALYVGEDDAAGLAQALADVQRPEVRGYLIRSGCELSRNYSWARSAERLAAVIQDQLAAGCGTAAALEEGG